MATTASGCKGRAPGNRGSKSSPATGHPLTGDGKGLSQAAGAGPVFTSDVSHQLRNPLNVILGFSELLLDEAAGKINQEQRQCLNDILNNAQRLLDLINHLSSHRGGEPAKDG